MMTKLDLKGFEEWLERGDKQKQRDSVRPRAVNTYISLLKNHSDCLPADDTVAAINEANRKMLDRNIYQVGVVVRLYCKYMDFRPEHLKLIKSPKPKKARLPKFLTKEELKALFSGLDQLKKIPYSYDRMMVELLLRVMYETGGRINEVLNISYKDIEQKIDTVSNGYVVHLFETTPYIIKRGSARDVMISQKTMDMLRIHMEKSRETHQSGAFIFSAINHRDPATLEEDERVNYYKWMVTRMNRLLEDIGKMVIGKKITSHWLRHTCATHMVIDGVNLVMIKDYMGHKSIKTTEIYLRAANLVAKQAFGKWGEGRDI
jgi:integrase